MSHAAATRRLAARGAIYHSTAATDGGPGSSAAPRASYAAGACPRDGGRTYELEPGTWWCPNEDTHKGGLLVRDIP